MVYLLNALTGNMKKEGESGENGDQCKVVICLASEKNPRGGGVNLFRHVILPYSVSSPA